MDKEKIFEALKSVKDPELGYNIVDLGLIYDVVVNDESVKVIMTFTTPMCPYGENLVSDVKECLKKLNAENFEVEIVFEPIWGLDKIKPEIREEFMLPIDV